MPLLRRRSSGDVHWSKDYIEHLRAVHFVLVVVAVTCIAVSRGPTFAQLQSAQHQIQTINVAIDKLTKDLEQEKKRASEEASGIAKTPVGPEALDDSDENWLAFTYAGVKYFAAKPDSGLLFEECQPFGNESRLDEDEWRSRFASITTWGALKDQWGQFDCSKKFKLEIRSIATALMLEREPDRPLIIKIDSVRTTRTKLLHEGYKQTYFRLWWALSRDKDFKSLAKQLMPANEVNRNGDEFDELYAPVQGSVGTSEDYSHPALGLFVKVDRSHAFVTLSDLGIQIHCHARFDICFKDLSNIAEGKEDYKLKELADFIDLEINHPAPDVEVFGIKIPAKDLPRWGMVFIISVLVYLCLHLRELAPKIELSDTGLDVAWLGLYSSWYSYLLFWFSVLVVPLTAVVLLGLNGSKHLDSFRSALKFDWKNMSLWVALPGVVCIVLGVSSCLAARRLALLAETARRDEVSEDLPC